MLKLINNKKPDQAILIAETKYDMDVLHFLYDAHICFGMWKIYDKTLSKERTSSEYKFLSTNFPLADGMAFINKIEGFVP
ncbi:MAG: hypothetical protein ACYDBX_03820 [Patescibacteria group bacterium]